MTEERLNALIKQLKYKTYGSSKVLQEIRTELQSYQNLAEWESIFQRLREEGVAHYIMPRTGLSGDSLIGKNVLSSSFKGTS
jgi:hypothetical protein